MNPILKIEPFVIDTTANYVFNGLTVTANVVSGNANLGNLVIANYFSGGGNNLSNIQGSNVSGQVGNSLIAGTVYTNAQPNITSIGTLTGLTSNGTVSFINASNVSLGSNSNVKLTGGTSGQYLSTDGSGNLSWSSIAVTTSSISNGNTSINIPTSNGNITLTSAGNANVVVVTGTGVNINGYTTITGNITSGNANLGNLVTANYFTGSGNNLSNIQGGNVSGQVGNSLIAGTVYTNAQPNITSLGTLSNLTVAGNVAITGKLTIAGNTTYINSNITYIDDPIVELGGDANGTPLSSNDSMDRGTYLHYYTTQPVDAFMGWKNANSEFVFASNANVTNNVVTINSLGNIRAGNANLGNAAVANYFIGSGNNLSNIQSSNITGTIANANYSLYAGTVITNAQPNITSVGTLTSLAVTGNITSGNANLGNLVTANYFIGDGYELSNITGANVAGQVGNSLVASTVYTNAQPNITSVGTLNGVTATGTINLTGASNVSLGAVGNVKVTGGSSGQYLQTDGTGNLSWNSISSATTITNGNSNINIPTANGNVTISAVGNNIVTVTGTGVNVSGYVTATGNVTANYFIGNGSQLTGIVATNANYANYAGNVVNASQPNITSVGTLTSLAVTGNISSGNANLGNAVVSNYFIGSGNNLSNIQGSNVSGAVAYATTANSVAGANVSGAVAYATTANSVAGANVSGQVGNSLVASTVYSNAQPNITSVGTLSSLTVSGLLVATGTGIKVANIQDSTGTISIATKYSGVAGDVGITGNLTVGTSGTGNVTANYFIGNGALLTGLSTTGSNISNVNSNVNIPSANGNVTVSVAGNANVVTVTGTGVNISGYVTATGNITGGNANLGNAVVANYFVGNGAFITGIGAPNAIYNGTSNLYVINNGNAVANIAGNNTLVITSTGVNAAGYITATGNVTANYFIGNGALLTGISTTTQLVNGNSNIVVDANSFIQFSANGVANVLTLSGTFANIGGNLNVSGRSNLGPPGNVRITGGSANSVLITDGLGDLSWGQAATMYADTFTGTGTQTRFGPLSATPTTINQTIVNYNGVIQLRSAYTLSGANVVFSSPPAFGALIEVTTIGVTAVVSSNGNATITNAIVNGNSNVVVNASGSIVITANGTYGVATFLDTGSNITSNLTVSNIVVSSTLDTSSGKTILGNVSNITITGGVTGQALTTDGTGNLSWTTITGGGGGGSGGGYYISNGNSSVTVNANAAITITANNVANIASFLDTGSAINTAVTLANDTSITGNLNLTGSYANLGPVGNVKITGGTSGYYLRTDGTGNLSWNAVTATGYNISNGNSNVTVTGNSAINFSANGTANIASFLDTTSYINSNITMTKVTTLGSNSNIKISGGTNGQVLSTDGSGNLSWTSAAGASAANLYSDTFTGTGLQTTFGPLSYTPTNVSQTWVNYNGVLQLRNAYSLSGANIVFSAPPSYGSTIEVTTISSGAVNAPTPASIARQMVFGILFGG